MKVTTLETFVVSVPYSHRETSTRVDRGGVTDVIVKLTTDEGLVGWGESCVLTDANTAEAAVRAAAPFVIGRDPWETEAIARDFFGLGLWDFAIQTGNLTFAGVDQALWDLCGKECGQPLHRLFGGAMRPEVDYFYYLQRGNVDEIAEQCRDGIDRGYTCYYIKVGLDEVLEEEMIAAIRSTVGPRAKIRIDTNQGWTVPQAVRIIRKWNDAYGIDFCEAPVRADPVENMVEVRNQTSVAICANEGLGSAADAMRLIRGRAADVLCVSSYWVGSFRRFITLCDVAALEGLQVVKHTHGELGIAAAAAHHVLLTIPNAAQGSQQTAMMMQDDILTERLPIADGPRWGILEKPGLGIEVDEDKVATYHELYLRNGQFMPYRLPSGDR
jgi:L-alanine-DL-glutamate epimerase-like enolase superfamily enzyme